MMKPTTPTEPRFIDEQNDADDFLPIFVTRTTLRSTLHKIGVDKLEDLETHSSTSLPNQTIAADKAEKE